MATEKVGVSLIAENGDEFVKQVTAASTAEKQLGETGAQVETISQKEADALLKLGVSADYIAQNFKILNPVVQENTQLTTQNTNAVTQNGEAHTKTGASAQSMFTTLREGRLVMGLMIADLALMQLTAGQTNPAIQEMSKGLQVVIDTGLLAFIATSNPFIAALVAIGAAMFVVGQAAFQATPEIRALDQEIASAAKKDDAINGMMQLSGATYEEAKAALEVIRANPAMAKSFKDLEDETTLAGRAMKQFTELFDGFNSTSQYVEHNLLTIISYMIAVQDLVRGMTLADAFADANARIQIFVDQEKEASNLLKGLIQSASDFKSARAIDPNLDANGNPLPKDVASGKTAANDRLRIQREYQDRLTDLGQQQIVQDMQNAITRGDIDTHLTESLADDWQRYLDKTQDIAYQQQQQDAKTSEQRVVDEQKAAQDIENIRNTLALNIADKDFSVAVAMAKSKSEREAEQLLFVEKQAVASEQNKTGLQIGQVGQRLTAEERALQTQMQNQDAAYQHERDVAQRTKDEEDARARRSNSDQLSDYEKRLAIQSVQHDQAEHNAQRTETEHLNDLSGRLDIIAQKKMAIANIPLMGSSAQVQGVGGNSYSQMTSAVNTISNISNLMNFTINGGDPNALIAQINAYLEQWAHG